MFDNESFFKFNMPATNLFFKPILFFCCIFLSGISFSQSLSVRVEGYSGLNNVRNFQLYRNDSLIRKVELNKRKKAVVKHLPKGKYRIDYGNGFGKMVSEHIEIGGKKKYNLVLDAGKRDSTETYIPVIDRLANGDSYTIHTISKGCFHSINDTIIISRSKNVYYIFFEHEKKALSAEQTEEIRNFERLLDQMPFLTGCTTIADYEVLFRGEIAFAVTDEGCVSGNAYFRMLDKLRM